MDKKPHHGMMSSAQRYEPIHSTIPDVTLRNYVEKETHYTYEKFLTKATNPDFAMYQLFVFFQENPALADQYIFPMIVQNLKDLRWYLFAQQTPSKMKNNPLIIEETAQTVLGIINSFKPHARLTL
jgi:hypothetical protein